MHTQDQEHPMASSSPLVPTSSVSSSSSSTGSPCAACKFLRRKCQPDCVFAPYFPPDNPQKFVNVHRVFGASNVTKILNDLHPFQREDAVNSLAYEADMRLQDPVYGCVKVISLLQHQLRQLQADLSRAKFELARYQSAGTGGPSAGFAQVGGGQGLIGINHPIGIGGFGFGREHFLPLHQNPHMVMKNYDADFAARLGTNRVYDGELVATMNTGIGPMIKSSSAGGDERPGIGPS